MLKYSELTSNNELIINIINDLLCDKKIVFTSNSNGETIIIKEYLEKNNFIINEISKATSELDEDVLNDKKHLQKEISIYRSIEKYKNSILLLNRIFTLSEKHGLSLVEMYKLTGSGLIKDEKIQTLYSKLINFNKVANISFTEIKKISDNLKNVKLISNYVKYRRFKKNSIFKNIKEKVDSNDINLVLYKINGLLNNRYALTPPLNNTRYTEEFIKNNIWNKRLNDVELQLLCSEINRKVNGDNLDNRYIPSWKSIFRWKKHKELMENNKAMLNKNNITINKILEEYKENIENLDIYYNSFSFLNKVFTEDFLEEIQCIITDGDEFEKYLTKAYECIVIYQNFSSIKINLNRMSDIEEKLLNICFEVSNNESEINMFIEILPNLILHEHIMNIHDKGSNVINTYKDFSNILLKLFNNINVKRNIINNYSKKNNVFIISSDFPINNLESTNLAHYSYEDILKNSEYVNTSMGNGKCYKDENECKSMKYLLNPSKEIKQIAYDLGLKISLVGDTSMNQSLYKIYSTTNSKRSVIIYTPCCSSDIYLEIDEIFKLIEINAQTELIWLKDIWEKKEEQMKYLRTKLNSYFDK